MLFISALAVEEGERHPSEQSTMGRERKINVNCLGTGQADVESIRRLISVPDCFLYLLRM